MFDGSERLVLGEDRATGLRAAIAIDDTTLGPGLGGVRCMAYPSEAAAIVEARRLAAAMTRKNAAAELPYGGAKSVILADRPFADRAAAMRAFGRVVAGLGGAYVPGVDMGTTVEDLRAMGAVGIDVACAEEDPSPWTALGVLAGIRAAVEHIDGRGLDGVVVAVQGAGHVGAALCRLLADEGAQVVVSDVEPAHAAALAADVGGRVVAPEEIVAAACDVLAPCAVARVVGPGTVDRLRCRIIAGAANDVLSTPADAAALDRRGIAYVPDFVLNAGGVIQIHGLREGWPADRLRAAVVAIGDRVAALLAAADAEGVTPLHAAEALVERRLASARERRAHAAA